MSATVTCFGYRIREESGGWRWTTFDSSGAVRAEGRAPSRAAAAAQVIRELAEETLGVEPRAA
jgi:hypothetical protein